jgi:hypothetical protein
MMKWQPTQAQQLLINGLLSIMASAATASIAGLIQAFQLGNINLWACLIVAMTTFGTLFWHALYSYVPGHVADELHALQDTQAQLQESHNAALQALNNAFSTIGLMRATAPVQSAPVPSSPLVVIHAQNATPTSNAPVQESASPTPATLVQPTATYLTNNASGSTVAVPSTDLLADLPQTSGVAPLPGQITGVIPTYGTPSQ